jgi:prepilin-type N-terminal cleavage/methylation domain-containing protein
LIGKTVLFKERLCGQSSYRAKLSFSDVIQRMIFNMKVAINKKTALTGIARPNRMSGFSLIELIIVVVIVAILSAISIPYIYNYTKLYKSEDQALKVMDLMREANQLALTRRRTMRLEIDLTANRILIIDEGLGAAPDTEIKSIPLEPVSEIRMDAIPTGINKPNPPNYDNAIFAVDAIGHRSGGATVVGNTVWAARFQSDGSIFNANNVPINANLYVWSPLTPGNAAARSNEEVRAITVFGGSGAVRYWKHSGGTFVAY